MITKHTTPLITLQGEYCHTEPWNDPLVGSLLETPEQLWIVTRTHTSPEVIEVEVEKVASPNGKYIIQILTKTKEIHGMFYIH